MINYLVDGFNLFVSLRACHRRERLFDLEVVVKLLEFVAIELFVVIQYEGGQYPITTDDVFIYEPLIFVGMMDASASASTYLVK